MDATLEIILAAGAAIEIEEISEKKSLAGNSNGIASESWETIRRNKIF
jgi:isocitrate dehydrogenase